MNRYLLPLFAFLLPIQTTYLVREVFIGGEKWQYGTIGLSLSDVVLVAMLIAAMGRWLSSRSAADRRAPSGVRGESRPFSLKTAIFDHKTEASLVMLGAWAGLSVWWAPDPTLGAFTALKLAAAVGLFFIARSVDDKTARMTLWALFAAAVLQSGMSVWQFLQQSVAASTVLGMSAQEAWQAGASVLKLESGRWLRGYGTFPHPNMLGGFLAAALVLTFAIGGSRGVERGKRTGLPSFILSSVSGILILLGILLSFSRAAWLGVGLGTALTVLVSVRGGALLSARWREYATAFKTFVVLLSAAAVFVFVLRDQVFPRFDTAVIGSEGSVSDRVVSMQDAARLIGNDLFAGIGAGNFTAGLIRHEPDRPVWSIQPAHNVFALVWAELGIVGLVLLVVFLVGVGRDAARRPGAFLVALCILIPSFLMDHWLWTSHFGVLFLLLLSGLATRSGADRER